MAEPIVFDVRHGLTTDVLDGLHEAQRVPLAVTHQCAAVLGFWIGDNLRVALIDTGRTQIRLAGSWPAPMPDRPIAF